MRSPKDMRTIQIDITNACVHKCSNCTRFCGHHKKPFFMEWETFKKAVDSLSGFKKRIGIMGGEPTLHPQFERFVRYLGEKHHSS
jgi:MoaA/NifB/PqqE/SkfB family radical SAM enzyme